MAATYDANTFRAPNECAAIRDKMKHDKYYENFKKQNIKFHSLTTEFYYQYADAIKIFQIIKNDLLSHVSNSKAVLLIQQLRAEYRFIHLKSYLHSLQSIYHNIADLRAQVYTLPSYQVY